MCRRIAAPPWPAPARSCTGAALFADIAGFTPLTEALTQALGPRRGVETLTTQINAVYEALVAAVDRQHGSVIGFAGDSLTCWFDDTGPAAPGAQRAGCRLRGLGLIMDPARCLNRCLLLACPCRR
jgi:class 3 adenylate cyclase